MTGGVSGRDVLVEPVARLVGHVAVPGDKSISHRAVLLGAICDGDTPITGFGRSADTEATIAAVRSLGVEVDEDGVESLRVHGKGLTGLSAPHGPIDCENAGTLVRLVAGILAGQDGRSFTLAGDASLSRRPMRGLGEDHRTEGGRRQVHHLTVGEMRRECAGDVGLCEGGGRAQDQFRVAHGFRDIGRHQRKLRVVAAFGILHDDARTCSAMLRHRVGVTSPQPHVVAM